MEDRNERILMLWSGVVASDIRQLGALAGFFGP